MARSALHSLQVGECDMSLNLLLPMLITGAGTGLTCGLGCGACGNPIVNVFLASYLFTHTGRLKQSVISFLGFHLGKALSVMAMCGMISVLGSSIVDENGNLFGISLQTIVFSAMFVFALLLIVRWFWDNRKNKVCSGECSRPKARSNRFGHMLVYGIISGMSPCASLVIVLGYASALTTTEALLVGASFSLANSLIPLLLLVVLTGVLSREMFREIPAKVRYFQLAAYIFFAVALANQLFK